MKLQFNQSLNRPRRAAIFAAAALLLWAGCPQSGKGQTPVVNGSASLKPPVFKTDMDATDIRDGIRKGSLFYAAAPLSEEALRRLDGTPAEASVTVPLMVDWVNNRLYVQALLNNRKVRLLLDTAGGPSVALDEAAARSVKLTNKVPVQTFGSQGTETVTLGLAHSLILGKLTLRSVATTVSRGATLFGSTLGMEVFEHYRVTLDFAAKTMTLTRGGVPTPIPESGTLSVPFVTNEGGIFIPTRVLGQDGWALLDSGSDETCLSFKAAKAAATHLPPSGSKTVVVDKKFGSGNTAKKATAIGLRVPVPISMNTGHDSAEFSTTTQIGMSDIDDVLDPDFDGHGNINALLGFPFLLQFQRVIIDYPAHTLVLQYPAHDTPKEVAGLPTKHDRAWPGYKWRQKGYAWIEVPDGKNPPPAPVNAPTQTTTTTTTTGTTTITTLPDGTIAVIVNGVKSSYPSGSTVKIDNDGSVHIVPPPGSASPATSTGGR